jgi:hypothetical protein
MELITSEVFDCEHLVRMNLGAATSTRHFDSCTINTSTSTLPGRTPASSSQLYVRIPEF